MPQYDFSQLSPHDFEVLCGGILSSEWDRKLEIFRAGRDQGIDLRYSNPAGGRDIIVQCKHYALSGYNKLYHHLENDELPKVKKLMPGRYVLATSVALSPQNKTQLMDLFKPFIHSTGDIVGRDEINLLLEKHPSVEKANFKLWLTSVTVLERVLHNAEQCQTDFAVEKINAKLSLYVQNQCFPRALRILREDNIVIISGVPGVGKTTLAEMLIYSFMSSSYVPVVIRSELKEGRALFNPSLKQIFYFDDFLGQTFLREGQGFGLRNDDASIVDFVEMIQKSKNAKLIMTTREHIFANALLGSERLRHSPLIDHKCVLQIGDYNNFEKAKILYNHIYFSNLPIPYRHELIRGEFYTKIIDHKNFNPRLIEWLSSYRRVRSVKLDQYQDHVLAILNEPHEIWRDAFFNQISPAARSLLLYVFSCGGKTTVSQAELGWLKLHTFQSKKYNYVISEEGFSSALREVEGAFVTVKYWSVEFINPSIVDFFTALLRTSKNYILDLVSSAAYFKQIEYLWQLLSNSSNEQIEQELMKNVDLLVNSTRTICGRPPFELVQHSGNETYSSFDTKSELQLLTLIKIFDKTGVNEFKVIIRDTISCTVSYWESGYCNFEEAVQVLPKLKTMDTRSVEHLDELRSRFELDLREMIPTLTTFTEISTAFTYYQSDHKSFSENQIKALRSTALDYLEQHLSEDIDGYSHDETTLSDMRDLIQQIAEEFEHNVDHELENIDEAIAKCGYTEDYDEDDIHESIRQHDSYENSEYSSISNLFAGL